MAFRIAVGNEAFTHAAYRQFSPSQSVLPIVVVFKIIGLHGCPFIPTDEEYGQIINLIVNDQGNFSEGNGTYKLVQYTPE